MTPWTVSIPVWGEWHTGIFRDWCLPSLIANDMLGPDFTYFLFTDDPGRLESEGIEILRSLGTLIEYRDANKKQHGFSRNHLQAWRESERVIFMQPDCVLGRGSMDALRASSAKLIACYCPRTVPGDGMRARVMDNAELLAYSLDYLHAEDRASFWGEKYKHPGSRFLFRERDNVWARCFHLHPLMAVNDGRSASCEVTIDEDFVGAFTPEETWAVSAGEVAMCEITPRTARLPVHTSHREIERRHAPQNLANRWRGDSHRMHRFFFEHKIALAGTPKARFDYIYEDIRLALENRGENW